MKANPLIANPPWTAEEEDLLRVLAESGEPPAAIAQRLARGTAAVRHRFYKLGIPLKRTRIAGPNGKEFANHYERQFMEYLRGKGWVKGQALPPSKPLISGLLKKGWIERQDQDPKKEAFYRMTDAGLAGLKAPAPVRQGWTKQK
jgi:hypothetical protein